MMTRSVVEYLERSAARFPDKTAVDDGSTALTYRQLRSGARRIGAALAERVQAVREPVAVFLDKTAESIMAFQGVLYSGNFYCPLDSEMPPDRIRAILSVTDPKVILTDEAHRAAAEQFAGAARIETMEELLALPEHPGREESVDRILSGCTETDPLYVLFTSGSTGVPKGVLVSHRVIINYAEWLEETFSMDSEVVIGNQAPLYFDISMHDTYGAFYFGGTLVIIPPALFSFPARLIEFMNEKKISSILWVPSAMGIFAALKAFRSGLPQYLQTVMFAGEVLPRRNLDYWMEHLPDTVFANLYGPTETFVCTGYICDGTEPAGEPMPIGKPIANSTALLLTEDGREAAPGETGELCLRGSCLATGYYNNPEKTGEVFVQNPLQAKYPDRIYRTGDLVKYNEQGDLIYLSRRDNQIKHMGYRIELGEIETAGYGIPEIRDCVCFYDYSRKRIVFCYDGAEIEKKSLRAALAEKIPSYMMPGRFIHLDALPHNANGKIDRKKLSAEYS
ncbi:MAG: amino acid adenylation domain-containing protein [Firmicutes bacterium]|nr:amino acid adenylation domain-containing protein [Bacillota bacterium]